MDSDGVRRQAVNSGSVLKGDRKLRREEVEYASHECRLSACDEREKKSFIGPVGRFVPSFLEHSRRLNCCMDTRAHSIKNTQLVNVSMYSLAFRVCLLVCWPICFVLSFLPVVFRL